jgi:V/A-type H+-transporting ATPase subunit C
VEDFIYAVTRIHIHERDLLTRKDLEALVSASTLDEAYSVLAAKGWDTRQNLDPEALVNSEYDKTWDLIIEAAGDLEELNVFRLERDYHNIKAALQLVYVGEPRSNWDSYFMRGGSVSLNKIISAAETQDFGSLPKEMALAAKQGWDALCEVCSGQMCEIIIDRATLLAIDRAGKSSSSDLIRRYANFTVDMANVKIAARCHMMRKSKDFMQRAIAPGGALNADDLINAALAENDEQEDYSLAHFLRETHYSGATDADSPGAFERWCNDELMKLIRPQRNVISGVEPLAAYILAREAEIGQVRLILSAKVGAVGESALQERLGATYV